MNRHIFLNLPVANLEKSIKSFKALGFHNNPEFSDDCPACIVVSDEIFVMLGTH